VALPTTETVPFLTWFHVWLPMGDRGQAAAVGESDRPTRVAPAVSMYESGLERPVLIEEGTTDAWLECDLTVPVER